MKTRANITTLILSSLVCLLPISLALVVYNDLPEQIAIHWNSAGTPDNFAPKAVAAFGLPFLFLVINLFSKMILFNDPKRANTSQAMQQFATWMPPLLSLILVPITLFIAMGVNIPISLVVPVLVGIMLIIAGNYLPKSRQNYTIGIRLPWTLHNADIWNKTHRMAGYLYILGGIILVIGAFMFHNTAYGAFSLTTLIVILLVLAPMFYSYLLYKKIGNDTNVTDK